MEKIVITGGLGFIGSHIAEEMARKNFSVAVIDNSGNHANVSAFRNAIEIINSSIADHEKMRSALKDAKFVFHEAALASVQQCLENPARAHEINVLGTQNILSAAKENNVQRVILASSSAVYGNNTPPLKESMGPDPLSPYAEGKLQNEKDAYSFYEKHGLEAVCLRYFNVYGPRQDPNSQYSAAIPKFISLLKSGKQPAIYGDGMQTRDFIYVKDVVEANLLASKAGKAALGKTFNVGSGTPITVLSLLDQIGKTLGKKPAPKFEPPRAGEVRHSYADASLAKSALGFEAKWKLEDGLKETINSF